jgi:hypothetical protein
MKHRARHLIALLVLAVLTAAIAPPAVAEGTNLRWGECVADGGLRNLTFACNTNSATRTLVPSFVLPAAFPRAGAAQAILDITAADLVLPAWWDFRTCRSGSIMLEPGAVGPILCQDWSGGCQSGGIVSYAIGTHGPSTATLTVLGRHSCAGNNDLVTGVEYVGPPVVINSTRTVGTPSCAGCDIGVCIELVSIQLTMSGSQTTLTLTVPANGTDSHRVTWQGVGFTGPGACAGATAVQKSSWSLIKSLYR